MFNLAKMKEAAAPQAYKQEALLFDQTPEEQRLLTDSSALARIMISPERLQVVMSPEDAYARMVQEVNYWKYIDKFHPEYKDKVLHRAEDTAKQLALDMKEHPEKYPMPSKDQEGGGGGMGAMGANASHQVTSFVLPDGSVMVKQGGSYSINTGAEKVVFSAETDKEALKTGCLKVFGASGSNK